MKRWAQILLAVLFISTLLSGCQYQPLGIELEYSFEVLGDIEAPLTVNKILDYPIQKVTKDGQNYTAIALEDVIAQAKPRADEYDLLFIGQDGLSSKISGQDLSDCYISYSSQYDWEIITENHPISSQVKNLRNIVVITTDLDSDEMAIGIEDQSGFRSTTVGNLFLQGYFEKRVFEGQSEINNQEVTVYTTHRMILPTDLLTFEKEIVVFGQDGSSCFDKVTDESYFEITDTALSYTASDKTVIEDVVGVLSDPPLFSITDVASDTAYQLEKGNNVLVIELDGLGWEMFNAAQEKNMLPFMSTLPVQKALVVYPPISPVGLAAMLTGENPDINGVHDRETMDFNGQDIFEKAIQMGKSPAYIEGDTKMLNTSVEPVLSVTEEIQDGNVFKNTQTAIGENKELIFTHFHSIDDDATTYGPYSQENFEQILQIDQMVETLVESFSGTVIITADHGLHEIEGGGTHGRICYEDMLVPYIIYNK
ncbi:alkaline phosphatase family protein [Eubacteriaceae bacterium ES3]|nr:alkaline phosphatase family protein [Eubacteriaceae bacterium ES3]